MQHLNYCRQMVKQLRGLLEVPSQLPHHGLWRHLIDLAAASQKFLLPIGGRILEDYQLRGIEKDQELRLPFSFIALEWQEPTTNELRLGEASCPKRIAFARDDDDAIRVTPVVFVAAQGIWASLPDIGIPKRGWFAGRDEIGHVRFNTRMTAGSARLPASDYVDELSALLDFLNALECSNVRIERSEAAHTHKAMRKALPFDDYHILTIDVPGRTQGDVIGNGGQHRSPREHLRRGHIRRYESGMKVWVNATVVNPGIGGKVSKDYRLKAATQGTTA